MKATLFTIVVLIMAIFSGHSQAKTANKMKQTIVLVHGAWLDASCWDKVIPDLKAAGHEVITVNLPGHGKDNTPFSKITLQTYVDAVKHAVGNRTNVMLVGHSLGGLIVSQTAEQIPGQIGKLVYLAAFLPKNGESLLQLSSMPENKESLLGKYLRPDEKTGSGTIAKEGLRETFAADAPEAIANQLLETHKPDPMVPFVTPVAVTGANFGSITKTYIYTTDDKAVAYDLQLNMVRNGNVSRSYSIPASHTPFYSMPKVLSSIFLKESE